MKINRKEKLKFPLELIIESEEEFNFLRGVFEIASHKKKKEASNFNKQMDNIVFSLFDKYLLVYSRGLCNTWGEK